ncbi:hypothetical protein APHAL10511_006709 [Amanita phalloides]|nr:hypothetical protein APHAL10511_006709 [Amanita phalloides]
MFNPFSGWAENKKSTATALLPSIFGALPYPSAPSSSLKLMFTSFNPSILNCGVVSGEGQVLYQVVTDPHNPGYTVLKNASGKNVALVEWQSRPLVEIRGILSKQHIGDWMRLSRDRT